MEDAKASIPASTNKLHHNPYHHLHQTTEELHNERTTKTNESRTGRHTYGKSCDTCVMNAGAVCMGSGKRKDNGDSTYGMPMEEAQRMFPHGCDDYEISFSAFVDQEKLNGR